MGRLAELIGNHEERMSEIMNENLSSKNVKDIFFILDNDYKFYKGCYQGYGCTAKEVLAMIAEKSSGFVVDIANRFLATTYKMSEKQAWCIAFAYVKIEK